MGLCTPGQPLLARRRWKATAEGPATSSLASLSPGCGCCTLLCKTSRQLCSADVKLCICSFSSILPLPSHLLLPHVRPSLNSSPNPRLNRTEGFKNQIPSTCTSGSLGCHLPLDPSTPPHLFAAFPARARGHEGSSSRGETLLARRQSEPSTSCWSISNHSARAYPQTTRIALNGAARAGRPPKPALSVMESADLTSPLLPFTSSSPLPWRAHLPNPPSRFRYRRPPHLTTPPPAVASRPGDPPSRKRAASAATMTAG